MAILPSQSVIKKHAISEKKAGQERDWLTPG